MLILLLSCVCAAFAADLIAKTGKFSEAFDTPPTDGDSITVPEGVTLQIDTTTPRIKNFDVLGVVTVMDNLPPMQLFVEKMIVSADGQFSIGAVDAPFESNFRIVLTNSTEAPERTTDTDVLSFKMFAVTERGTAHFHAKGRTPTHTVLESTATVGDTSITLRDSVDWQVGDHIVIAVTDFVNARYSAERVISQINGRKVSFEEPLEFESYAETKKYGGKEVSMHAEVIVLTSNVVMEGELNFEPLRWDAERRRSPLMAYGGHFLSVDESDVRIKGVEFYHMGQMGRLGRYPVHWHHRGNAAGQYIKDSMIHQSFSRCITIHDTNDLVVTGNVCHDVAGHAIFLEDGTEHGNVFEDNVIIKATPVGNGKRLTKYKNSAFWPEGLRLDAHDGHPSGFWITNVNNTFRRNSVVDAHFGYWIKLNGGHGDNPKKEIPREAVTGTNLVMEDNVAHSLVDAGIWIWHDWVPHVEGGSGGCCSNVRTTDEVAVIKNTLVYKSQRGVQSYGIGMVNFESTTVVDVGQGFWHKFVWRPSLRITNALLVAESENHGVPAQCPKEGSCERSRVFPGVQRSYPKTVHDLMFGIMPPMGTGRLKVDGVTFVNYRAPLNGKLQLLYNQQAIVPSVADREIYNANFVNTEGMFSFDLEEPYQKDGVLRSSAYQVDQSLPCAKGKSTGHIFEPALKNATNPLCEFRTPWNVYYCADQKFRNLGVNLGNLYHGQRRTSDAHLEDACGQKLRMLPGTFGWSGVFRTDARSDGKPRRYHLHTANETNVAEKGMHFRIPREYELDSFEEDVEVIVRMQGKWKYSLYASEFVFGEKEKRNQLTDVEQTCACGTSFVKIKLTSYRVNMLLEADDSIDCSSNECDPYPLFAPDGYACDDSVPTFEVVESCYKYDETMMEVKLPQLPPATPQPTQKPTDLKLYQGSGCKAGSLSCACMENKVVETMSGDDASRVNGFTDPSSQCNEGLTCVKDLCIKATCVPGTAGCQCVNDAVCNDESLQCVVKGDFSVCVDAGPPEMDDAMLYEPCHDGAAGCKCYEGDCLGKLTSCVDDTCIILPCNGQVGCNCRADSTCDEGLDCAYLAANGGTEVCLKPNVAVVNDPTTTAAAAETSTLDGDIVDAPAASNTWAIAIVAISVVCMAF